MRMKELHILDWPSTVSKAHLCNNHALNQNLDVSPNQCMDYFRKDEMLIYTDIKENFEKKFERYNF